MTPCVVDDRVFLRYLANELHGRQLTEFLRHLRSCEACGQRLAEERALSALLKRSRPLYAASPALRTRVNRLFSEEMATARASERALKRSWRFFYRSTYPLKLTGSATRLDEGLGELQDKRPRCACLRLIREVFWWK
jgi:anti-sigma factor RsiW